MASPSNWTSANTPFAMTQSRRDSLWHWQYIRVVKIPNPSRVRHKCMKITLWRGKYIKNRDEKSRLFHRNWLSTKSGELNHFVVAPRPNHSHACLCLSHAVYTTHEDDKAHTHTYIFDNFIHSQRQHPALTMMATATIAKPIYFQSLRLVTLAEATASIATVTAIAACCCWLLLLFLVCILSARFCLFWYFSSTFICYLCSFSPLLIRFRIDFSIMFPKIHIKIAKSMWHTHTSSASQTDRITSHTVFQLLSYSGTVPKLMPMQ